MVEMILNQLKETSTWRGLIGVLSSLGIVISPDMATYIVAAGMGLSGLIGLLLPDRLRGVR